MNETETVTCTEARKGFSDLIDRVASGVDTVITRHGRSVAKIVAHRTERPPLFGSSRGQLKYGDVESPTGAEWEAVSNPDRVLDPSL